MATIIKKGDKTYNCGLCGCEFTIEHSDINWDDMAMCYEGLFPYARECASVKCPQCKNRVVIEWM